ncbi:hypothetical protein [Streptomyces sp. WAC05950]|uniref:hypothetical protein n=1 Tax=Streptomyces sp. WAC05950 TaxID=2487419 RepID=UPI000F743E4C|nr:hypothetical protein [Streptomyces sp. WAC05950]RSS93099.1 hypothetical protein EF904_29830 [Streptomyces sp. WAC05950]
MVDADAVAAELYGLRPEEFTAARDAHAAAARKAGQRAEAKRIAALRRPTLAVWAANRLARADADQAQHLLELGRGLREAHRTLSGEDLRKLSHQQHVVVAAMAGEARRLAGEAGQDLSAGVQREVEQILRSVLADPEAADTWARGVLEKAPPPAVGFAEVAPAPGTAPRPQQPEREPRPEPEPDAEPDDTQEAGRTSREAELAEAALALAETERERARAGLGALDERIARLEERLDGARGERERLAAAAEAAERGHQEAVREAKRARTAARKARRR